MKDFYISVWIGIFFLGSFLAGCAATGVERTTSGKEMPETFTNSIGMEFVLVPSGEFQMGSANGGDYSPMHTVRISKPFYIGRYEVTQSQWKAIMGDNPSKFKGENHPVDNVSWEYVQMFVKRLNAREKKTGYRLPTEAEWEYACRAGTTTAYYTGNNESDLARAGWYKGNSGHQTHPVGQKEPNSWGLHDTHGNVWEWCQDWWGPYPKGHVTDPKGPDDGSHKASRGGSWENSADKCRSANRRGHWPTTPRNFEGFRLALPQVSK